MPPPRARPAPPKRLVLLACLLLTAVAGCATPDARGATGPPEVDDGAAARQAVLDRYSDEPSTSEQRMPDLVGMRPDQAAGRLAELGLQMRLTPFDRTQPVSVTIPAAGSPTPLDGEVEVWLGVPPTALTDRELSPSAEVAQATAPAEPTAPTATPAPAATTSAPVVPIDQTPLVTTHVLPPHTDGILRINPRRLPALPLGTQLNGLASWYGPGFHGLTTACGGVYDQNGPTIAARELRCGTIVRIVGPTGLTVEATVTDWGPAEWTGRRFDLSAAVFNAIAPLSRGVIPVTVVTANVPG